ncbi:MAG TPA: (4Fe-4S)-binding protein [Bacteroidia bacterium]|jgi:uncharacterized Fe-S cluster protein YjdI|nr:(4Fe-4S)-binding protein [Bacteroidia bacterium]HQF27084.1 (4Fe-4S)-binding protein [Bacteroidia bacterium]HQK96629.1 (4Fe-4S)-binding protein [Bacteroidia bacterium]
MKDITKKYSNGEITVVWKPSMCIHSAICFKGLPDVFDPRKRPWVTPEGGSSEEIMKQIDNCPSGALSYYQNKEMKTEEPVSVSGESIVEVIPNGPLMVYGNLKVKTHSGAEETKNKVTAFCRCGHSSNKPYCDGTHRKVNFEG